MSISFALVRSSVVPIRVRPAHQAEQVSQLLFGERVLIFSRTKEGWLQIRCEWDGYEGWIKEGHVHLIEAGQYRRKLYAVSGGANDRLWLENQEPNALLSPGSSLFLIKGKRFLWDHRLFFKGKKLPLKNMVFEEGRLLSFCKAFLGAPYQWGGRSLMGIDCSGFAQVIYKLFNYRLPRDAYQQAQVGTSVDFLQEAQAGDLAFFDNEEGVIVHVGILLNNHTIVHASEIPGCVVIDAIDNCGIISREKKLRTHNLRIIKRYF